MEYFRAILALWADGPQILGRADIMCQIWAKMGLDGPAKNRPRLGQNGPGRGPIQRYTRTHYPHYTVKTHSHKYTVCNVFITSL